MHHSNDHNTQRAYNVDYPTGSRSRASLGKRSRDHSYDNSSDGPWFSSDDLSDACVGNYDAPRTKRQHRRTWWELESSADPTGIKAHAAGLDKPQDSGVFMASDGSSSSNEDGFGLSVLNARNLKRNSKKLQVQEQNSTTTRGDSRYKFDLIAHQIIQACLEADKEEIDLSRCSLTSLSNETIAPLRTLIRRPKIHERHQVEAAFQSFTPQLKLFLASNLLRALPSEILNLEHLTVLSLRNNKLTELPHSFGKLCNLVELNIAGNKLTWLPWEILSLLHHGKLRNLHIRPNPLMLPFSPVKATEPQVLPRNILENFIGLVEGRLDSIGNLSHNQAVIERLAWLSIEERALRLKLTAWQRSRRARALAAGHPPPQETAQDPEYDEFSGPLLLGTTPVYLMNSQGAIDDSLTSIPSQTPRDIRVLRLATPHNSFIPQDTQDSSRYTSQVPSLYELALRSCSSHLLFNYIDQDLPECIPEHVSRHLEAARNASEVGACLCTVCKKPFIVPRAEWIEYWHYVDETLHLQLEELWLPFLRRACTWGCAIRASEERMMRQDEHSKSINGKIERIEVVKESLRQIST